MFSKYRCKFTAWVEQHSSNKHHSQWSIISLLFLLVSDYGLFSQDDDPSKGKWLEPARTLDFYPLKSGVSNYYYSTTVGLSAFLTFHAVPVVSAGFSRINISVLSTWHTCWVWVTSE